MRAARALIGAQRRSSSLAKYAWASGSLRAITSASHAHTLQQRHQRQQQQHFLHTSSKTSGYNRKSRNVKQPRHVPNGGDAERYRVKDTLFPKGGVVGVPRNYQQTTVEPEEKDDGELGWETYKGEESPYPVINYTFGDWTPKSKRVGAIARKVGLVPCWDANGEKRVLTVLRMDECRVVNVKKLLAGRKADEPRIQMTLGIGRANLRRIRKAQLCQHRQWGVEPPKKMIDFPVTPDAVLPVNTRITCRHFLPGQYVDVCGTTRGKGFQGVMKRWNFKGQGASHGNTKSHRRAGGIGAGSQNPGRVMRGKKLPGRMGGKKVWMRHMLVYKLDLERDLIYLNNPIPGAIGSYIEIRDPFYAHQWALENPPPFPTHVEQEGEEKVNELIMDLSHLKDPFAIQA